MIKPVKFVEAIHIVELFQQFEEKKTPELLTHLKIAEIVWTNFHIHCFIELCFKAVFAVLTTWLKGTVYVSPDIFGSDKWYNETF